MALLLLQIPYDKTGGTHNLIGLIRLVAAYTMCYGAKFAKPTHVGSYNATIDDNATAVVCVHTEAACKANRAGRGTYETVQCKIAQFILTIIDDTWVRELQDTETLYTDVAPKAPLSHLQEGRTVSHALDLLALHNEMQHYHIEIEGIHEYINMLKDEQKQAGRAGQTIADETLLLFASTAMITTKR